MSVNLSPLAGAGAQFLTDAGTPLTGGLLYTYAAGTTTPAATYTDSAGSTPNANPIVLDSAGRVPYEIWLTTGSSYKFVLKTSVGATVGTWDNIRGVNDLPDGVVTDAKVAANAAIQGTKLAFLPSGAGAVSRTVQAKQRDTVSVKDFGAVGDGTTDDTAAIQAACTAGGRIYFPAGTYKVSSAITLISNSALDLDPNAIVTTVVTSISILSATSKTNVHIRGGTIQYTAAGATGGNGAVLFDTCTYCTLSGVNIVGGQYAGVYLTNSSNCTIRGNVFSGTLGTHPDAADISVRNTSNDNTISENQCVGSGAHGILVQGPGATIPLRNRVLSNFINAKQAYGIAIYQTTAADNYTVVEGNEITGILGTSLAGASGNGIYMQSAGGSVVANNIVKDCCLNTTSTTNSPACISISFDQTAGPTLQPITVVGNSVNSSKWSGIIVSSARGTVSGNSVNFTDTTNGYGILIYDSSNLDVTGNQVNLPTTVARAGIVVNTTLARGIENINVSNNTVFGGNDAQIFSIKSAAGTTISGVFSGNNLQSAGTSALGLALNNLQNAVVNGNYVNSAYIGFYIQNCTNVRGSGNVSRAGSLYRFLSGGTCSNVYFDDSNDFDMATPAKIQNTVTGVAIEQRSNGSPGGGNWQIGDRICQTVPVVGQPKGWRCTVAGSPGTWVSEGNL